MNSLVVRIEAAARKADALKDLLSQLADDAATEPGTLVYILNQEDDNPSVFWLYELYRDAEAQKLHSDGEFFKSLLPQVLELLAEPMQLTRMKSLVTSFPAERR